MRAEINVLFATPRQDALVRDYSPTMKMPHEQETLMGTAKAPGCGINRCRNSVKVPQLRQISRDQPRLYVGEKAILDFQSRIEAGHEADYLFRIASYHICLGLKRNPKIVVSPDADSLGLNKPSGNFLKVRTRLYHIAKDHNLIHFELLESP